MDMNASVAAIHHKSRRTRHQKGLCRSGPLSAIAVEVRMGMVGPGITFIIEMGMREATPRDHQSDNQEENRQGSCDAALFRHWPLAGAELFALHEPWLSIRKVIFF